MSNLLKYGALALVGTEVTGITNFSGASGGQSPLPQVPDINLPEIGAPNVSIQETGSDGKDALLAAVASNQDSGPTSETIGAIRDMQETTAGLTAQVLALQNRGSDSPANPSNWREMWEQNKPDIPGTPDMPGNGPTPTQGGNGGSDGLDLQDYGTPGDGSMGIGDYFAIAGESGQAAGSTINDVVQTGTKGSNTLAQSVRALAGKEYNTENTFANSGQAERRRLYEGNLIGGSGSNFLGEQGVINNLDGNVTESIGRTFDNQEGGGVIDGFKETFGL